MGARVIAIKEDIMENVKIAMSKETPTHHDKLGTVLTVDSYVAFPSSNQLDIGVVKKLNPKMIGISVIAKRKNSYFWSKNYVNKYPYDCVIIDKDKVLMFMLKYGNH